MDRRPEKNIANSLST